MTNEPQQLKSTDPLARLFDYFSSVFSPIPAFQVVDQMEISSCEEENEIMVSLFVEGKEVAERIIFINTADFEEWADEEWLLQRDDTSPYVDWNGEYQERGSGTMIISFWEYVNEFMTKKEVIQYLKEKNLIPSSYEFCKNSL